MACSLERPPKTTATRGLRAGRGASMAGSPADPYRRCRPAARGAPARGWPHTLADLRPATPAVHLGRPPHEPDQPLNTPITMASTYVAGGDLEYGRYANPTWTAFEEALGALEGGRCLAFASGLAAVATILDLVGHGREGGRAPARLQRQRRCSSPTSRPAAG